MRNRSKSKGKQQQSTVSEFDLAKAWADSRYDPKIVYRMWHALYKAQSTARKHFPDVDWISLIAIFDVLAIARANRRRVDVSYLAEEMGWPRTTALRRLNRYAETGYLTLTRHGRHTYINSTPKARRGAAGVIDTVIDSIDWHLLSESDG
jgi:DNA-binding MarR family transcriptional regulator